MILAVVDARPIERSARASAVGLEKCAPWTDAQIQRPSALIAAVDRESDVRLRAVADWVMRSVTTAAVRRTGVVAARDVVHLVCAVRLQLARRVSSAVVATCVVRMVETAELYMGHPSMAASIRR
jgi:hypothetical protein